MYLCICIYLQAIDYAVRGHKYDDDDDDVDEDEVDDDNEEEEEDDESGMEDDSDATVEWTGEIVSNQTPQPQPPAQDECSSSSGVVFCESIYKV